MLNAALSVPTVPRIPSAVPQADSAGGAARADQAPRGGGAASAPSVTPAAPAERPSEAVAAPENAAETKQAAAERERLADLRRRDRQVRAHEQAHATVGGRYAGAPSYTYERGPDGVNYAVAGEVPIDVSPVPGDPAATIDKMEVVKRAALAPAEPSAQDRRVAAIADARRLEATAELRSQEAEAAGDVAGSAPSGLARDGEAADGAEPSSGGLGGLIEKVAGAYRSAAALVEPSAEASAVSVAA